MSIILFALIGATLHMNWVYWLFFGFYCFFKLIKGIANVQIDK